MSEWCEHAYPPNADCPWCNNIRLLAEIERLNSELTIANKEHLKTGKAWAATLYENERLRLLLTSCLFCGSQFDSISGLQRHSSECQKNPLRQRVAELETDIEKYRWTIAVCSGSCTDYRGSIVEETGNAK